MMELTDYQISLVKEDICPRCQSALDTGWECTSCGYDAKWIADSRSFNEKREGKRERA